MPGHQRPVRREQRRADGRAASVCGCGPCFFMHDSNHSFPLSLFCFRRLPGLRHRQGTVISEHRHRNFHDRGRRSGGRFLRSGIGHHDRAEDAVGRWSSCCMLPARRALSWCPSQPLRTARPAPLPVLSRRLPPPGHIDRRRQAARPSISAIRCRSFPPRSTIWASRSSSG